MNWFFLLFGLIIVARLVFAIRKETRRTKLLQRAGIRTQGKVLRNSFRLGRISVTRPVIQFTTQTGEVIEATDMHGTAMVVPKFSEGQNVTLFYEEDNPRNFTITTSGRYS